MRSHQILADGRRPMPGERRDPAAGFVVWLEGLPGAGKSTLGRNVAAELSRRGLRPEILDGEEVRKTFFPELGFSRKDREAQARRVSRLARLLADHGTAVVVAMITPYETSRQAARAAFGDRFVEVWLSCPLEVCEKRDPGGIYRRSHEGGVPKMTGVDDPFEEPLNPDLTVETSGRDVAACTRAILDHLSGRGLLDAIPA
ncbi:MAG: adenylyl-sulfate kinase [Thermoplasmata archaeon]|nr:adenylyl-sulfate kinase [Thermoplasmata archaeon]